MSVKCMSDRFLVEIGRLRRVTASIKASKSAGSPASRRRRAVVRAVFTVSRALKTGFYESRDLRKPCRKLPESLEVELSDFWTFVMTR